MIIKAALSVVSQYLLCASFKKARNAVEQEGHHQYLHNHEFGDELGGASDYLYSHRAARTMDHSTPGAKLPVY
jgi:hypothetical protein